MLVLAVERCCDRLEIKKVIEKRGGGSEFWQCLRTRRRLDQIGLAGCASPNARVGYVWPGMFSIQTKKMGDRSYKRQGTQRQVVVEEVVVVVLVVIKENPGSKFVYGGAG